SRSRGATSPARSPPRQRLAVARSRRTGSCQLQPSYAAGSSMRNAEDRMTARYAYVIGGGGSAGCCLANRLTEDPGTRVPVLEAGRSDWAWDIFTHMPAALTMVIG